MTVAELIAALQKMPQDMPAIISDDGTDYDVTAPHVRERECYNKDGWQIAGPQVVCIE